MRQFHYLLLLLASFVFITACSDDDFYANPVLEISKTSLEFEKTASQASIDVTKNKNDEYYALLDGDQGAEWLKVVQTDSGFNVVVEENTGTIDRIATITLVLKRGTLPTPVTLRVKQLKNSNVNLTLSEGDQRVPSHGGEVVVYLLGNFTKTGWSASSDASWIKLDVAGLDYKFTLRTLDNPTTAERTAKVTITTEQGATASLNVSQDGSITWELPYIDFGYDLEKRRYRYPYNMTGVAKFEVARGSTFFGGRYGILFTWSTKSALIPKYDYYVSLGETTLREVVGQVSNTDYWTDPLYIKYLESEGFKLTYADDQYDDTSYDHRIVYWNKEREASIVHTYEYNEVAFMQARNEFHHHEKGQLRPCTTFETLPSYFFDETANLAAVDAWEAGQKSTQLLRNPYPSFYTFTPDPSMSKEIVLERVYVIKDDVLQETWMLFEDIELVFFQNGTVLFYIATNEFKALMESKGFVLELEDPYNGILFNNPTLGIDLYACIRGYESEDMLPRLVIQIAPIGLGGIV